MECIKHGGKKRELFRNPIKIHNYILLLMALVLFIDCLLMLLCEFR